MTKLSAIVALSNGLKERTRKEITTLHRSMDHEQGMKGLVRIYRSHDEEGEQLPTETKVVQVLVNDLVNQALIKWKNLWELILAQDVANTEARADIVVDDVVLCETVPVTTLIWLQKQLDDVRTFVSNIPILDPSQEWHFDDNTNCYVSKRQETTRTKKVLRNHVKAEATKEHPAQVEVYQEDVVVGYWSKVEQSGMIPAKTKVELIERIEKVQDAVKVAKENANTLEVSKQERLAKLFDYLQ